MDSGSRATPSASRLKVKALGRNDRSGVIGFP
jgi:hypothetical protein